MKKKVVAVFLAMVMAFGCMTGCANDGTTDTTGTEVGTVEAGEGNLESEDANDTETDQTVEDEKSTTENQEVEESETNKPADSDSGEIVYEDGNVQYLDSIMADVKSVLEKEPAFQYEALLKIEWSEWGDIDRDFDYSLTLMDETGDNILYGVKWSGAADTSDEYSARSELFLSDNAQGLDDLFLTAVPKLGYMEGLGTNLLDMRDNGIVPEGGCFGDYVVEDYYEVYYYEEDEMNVATAAYYGYRDLRLDELSNLYDFSDCEDYDPAMENIEAYVKSIEKELGDMFGNADKLSLDTFLTVYIGNDENYAEDYGIFIKIEDRRHFWATVHYRPFAYNTMIDKTVYTCDDDTFDKMISSATADEWTIIPE